MTKFDLISMGDNATDAFIRLSEAELNCQIDKPECKICMKFASKIPYESVTEIPAGGNSSNVTLGSAKLGLNVAYISNVGDDDHGRKTLAKLKDANADTTWIKTHVGIPTNYNYVLWYADDRTILVKHEDYANDQFLNFLQDGPDSPRTDWLYLSSINDSDFSLHQKISDWFITHPEVKLAFSPGTWQIKAGTEKLKDIYAHTEILFCNKQEAEKIAEGKVVRETTSDGLVRDVTSSEANVGSPTSRSQVVLHTLAEQIKKLGPKTVIITDGENGASVLDANNNFFQTPALKIFGPAIERTGAGDAFASAFLAATIDGLSSEEALVWGATNSASVVTKIGPHEGLLTRSEIKKY